VSASEDNDSPAKGYDVGVAIVPIWQDLGAQRSAEQPTAAGGIPGYDETAGRGRSHSTDRGALFIERGEEAVRAATEAIAAQIGLATQRIASEIGGQIVPSSVAGSLDLESINVSFGVTLSTGVQALFTAQAESSVQVTITLIPHEDDNGSDKV
jgi:hypothetical protein